MKRPINERAVPLNERPTIERDPQDRGSGSSLTRRTLVKKPGQRDGVDDHWHNESNRDLKGDNEPASFVKICGRALASVGTPR